MTLAELLGRWQQRDEHYEERIPRLTPAERAAIVAARLSETRHLSPAEQTQAARLLQVKYGLFVLRSGGES